MFIYYLLFTYVPIILNYIVPALQSVFCDQIVYCIVLAGTIATVTLAFNFTMYFVYTLKIPFFEQYRINPNVLHSKFRNHGLGKKTLDHSKSC